jgi:nicotinamidase/pyrazinamidase
MRKGGWSVANAVLVIDMLRCFLEEGKSLYCGARARRIIPKVAGLIERELKSGSKIFFICDHHDLDDLEFRMFPPHCIAGTAEAMIIPELAKYPGKIIYKKRYSAFFGTPLERNLKNLNPERIIVCGVCTNICVMHTVADARNRDYEVEVPIDCVAALNQKAHRFALDHMKQVLGARLTSFSARAKKA